MDIQKKVGEFFENHPTVNEVYEALGVLFIEPGRAKKFLGGVPGRAITTYKRESKPVEEPIVEKPEVDELTEEQVADQFHKPVIEEETKPEEKKPEVNEEKVADQLPEPSIEEESKSEEVITHTVTEEDIKEVPELADAGIKAGEVVEYPYNSEEAVREAVKNKRIKKSEKK